MVLLLSLFALGDSVVAVRLRLLVLSSAVTGVELVNDDAGSETATPTRLEQQEERKRERTRDYKLGLFRSAGLMVPEPSMRLFPIPFIGAGTGAEVVVYMTRTRREAGERSGGGGCQTNRARHPREKKEGYTKQASRRNQKKKQEKKRHDGC